MLRVVKVGGSLMSSESTKQQLLTWMNRQSPAKTVMIGGGGRLVDEVRQWDRDFKLGPDLCHRLALDCMSLTNELLANWFASADQIDCLTLVDAQDSALMLLDCKTWVLAQSSIPATWQMTSDSISAAVAAELAADELVLLKSCLPSDSVKEYYDPLFSGFVGTHPVRVVSLKSKDFDEVTYQ